MTKKRGFHIIDEKGQWALVCPAAHLSSYSTYDLNPFNLDQKRKKEVPPKKLSLKSNAKEIDIPSDMKQIIMDFLPAREWSLIFYNPLSFSWELRQCCQGNLEQHFTTFSISRGYTYIPYEDGTYLYKSHLQSHFSHQLPKQLLASDQPKIDKPIQNNQITDDSIIRVNTNEPTVIADNTYKKIDGLNKQQIIFGNEYTAILKNGKLWVAPSRGEFFQVPITVAVDGTTITQITQIACTRFSMTLIITILSTGKNALFVVNNFDILAMEKNNSALELELQDTRLEHIKKVVCGDNHIVYLIAGSQIPDHNGVWGFGANNRSQLGLDDRQKHYRHPTKISDLDNVIDIACGREHTVLLTNDGQLWGAGRDDLHQLSVNNSTPTVGFFKWITCNSSTIEQAKDQLKFVQLATPLYDPKEIKISLYAQGHHTIYRIDNLKNKTRSCSYTTGTYAIRTWPTILKILLSLSAIAFLCLIPYILITPAITSLIIAISSLSTPLSAFIGSIFILMYSALLYLGLFLSSRFDDYLQQKRHVRSNSFARTSLSLEQGRIFTLPKPVEENKENENQENENEEKQEEKKQENLAQLN